MDEQNMNHDGEEMKDGEAAPDQAAPVEEEAPQTEGENGGNEAGEAA